MCEPFTWASVLLILLLLLFDVRGLPWFEAAQVFVPLPDSAVLKPCTSEGWTQVCAGSVLTEATIDAASSSSSVPDTDVE